MKRNWLAAFLLCQMAMILPIAQQSRADGFMDCINAAGPDRLGFTVDAIESAADFLDNPICTGEFADPWFDGICGGIASGMVAANLARSEPACMDLPTEPAGSFLVNLVKGIPGPWQGALSGSIEQEQEEVANLIPGYSCVCKYVGFADDAAKIVNDTRKMWQDSSDCADWLINVFGPAGQAAVQLMNQAAQDLENAYNTVVQTFNDIGCGIMGNCGSGNPPPTHDQYYAKVYAPAAGNYTFASDATVKTFLVSARQPCLSFWNFWDAVAQDNANFGAILSASRAGESGPGAKTCDAFEDRFRTTVRTAHDSAVIAAQKEATQIGESFAIILNALYLGQCQDSQCRAGVFFLSFAVVGEFKQVAAKAGNNPNDPKVQDALQKAKYDIPKKYKPKYQILISESDARMKAALAADQAKHRQLIAMIAGKLATANDLMTKYKLEPKQVVIRLRLPTGAPRPGLPKLKTHR